VKRVLVLAAVTAFMFGCQALRRVDYNNRGTISIKEDPCADLSSYELTPENEYYLGRAAAANVIARYGVEKVLAPDHPLSRYVTKVGHTVAAAAEARGRDGALRQFASKPGLDDRAWPVRGYHFLVVDWPQPNAHGLPGGYVIVTTGLLKLAKSEDDVAGVLAHEIAHVRRGHGVEIVKRSLCDQVHANDGLVGYARREVSRVTITSLVGQPELAAQLFDGAVGQWYATLEKGYGKEDELEADSLSAHYNGVAGYDPSSLQSMLGRLPPQNGKGIVAGLTSSHPPTAERLKNLRSTLATAKLSSDPQAQKLRASRFAKGLGGG